MVGKPKGPGGKVERNFVINLVVAAIAVVVVIRVVSLVRTLL